MEAPSGALIAPFSPGARAHARELRPQPIGGRAAEVAAVEEGVAGDLLLGPGRGTQGPQLLEGVGLHLARDQALQGALEEVDAPDPPLIVEVDAALLQVEAVE